MFALDRLKVVMPLEHVTVLNESVFTVTVIKYFIKQISIHRHQEMCDELEDLLKKVKNEKVREILENVSGFETF